MAIERSVRAAPDLRVRVWSETRPFDGTLAEVYDSARRLAGRLAARGIGPGDVVAFQLPNWIEASITFYGVSLVGAAIVPVVHFYGPKELHHILSESGARAFITAASFGHLDYMSGLEKMLGDLASLELVAVVGVDEPPSLTNAPGGTSPEVVEFSSWLASGEPFAGPSTVDPDDPAVVGYTSGTTAHPKGVIHTHRSLMAEMRQVSTMRAQNDDRPALVGAPVGHAIGMQAGLLAPLLRGHDIHLIDQWNPTVVLAAMIEAGLTSGSGSTYFLQSLLDDPTCTPEHHRLIAQVGMGGAAVPPAVADRARELGISVVRSYGSTEHPSTTGSQHTYPYEQRAHTDGRLLPGVELRIVDEEGNDLPTGTAGEILSRGPDLFAGYTDPALTANAVDEQGWYSTGDIGVLDANGCLTITDRLKDIIIRGGENISAAEIEELLISMPSVAEVAVVAAPDARLGEHACAFVRLRPGSDASAAPSLEAIRSHLQERRPDAPEMARGTPHHRRLPAHPVRQGQEVRSARAAAF